MEKLFAAIGGTAKVVDIAVKLVMAIIIFIVLRKLYINYIQRNAGKAFVDKSNLDPAKNYDNIAKSVHDAFTGLWKNGDDMESVSKSLLFLSDNELKEVNNRYVKLYGNGKTSLQDAISEPFCVFCETRDLLLERLSRLNLN